MATAITTDPALPHSPDAPPASTDTEALGRALDRIRADVLARRGAEDARYIHTIVALHRRLEIGGRAALAVSLLPPAWLAGTAALATAKILENLELGHNIMHGQWDWMRDPAIHSTTWEWDNPTPSDAWKHTHNNIHHTWTNVVGRDRDLGFTVLRMSKDQPWHPGHLAQPFYAALGAPFFEWLAAVYDLEADAVLQRRKPLRAFLRDATNTVRKAARQAAKDYLLFPLLAGPSAVPCLLGNFTANTARSLWAHAVIFCGHFPDGVRSFTEEETENETRGEWYLRQALGSANLEGGTVFHVLTGNLSHQIEHHLYPDLPSNRYAEIAPQVREVLTAHGIPYTTGPLLKQYASTWTRICRMALPDVRRAE